MLVLISVLILLCQHSIPSFAQNEAYWTYDLISLEVENHTPDVAVIDLHEKRVSRGVFADNIKQDITDDFKAGMATYYSLRGQNFVKALFLINDCNLTEFARTLILNDLKKCSENIPNFYENFQPPLKPQTIKFNNCFISNDKLPTRVKIGFYKLVFEFKNQVKSSVIYNRQVFQK